MAYLGYNFCPKGIALIYLNKIRAAIYSFPVTAFINRIFLNISNTAK